MGFPNRAGDHPDTDAILEAELRAAGISLASDGQNLSDTLRAILRQSSGEVKTSGIGYMHGWEFRRAWYYWICSGPGIELEAAERLHATHGHTVRVGGGAGDPPGDWSHGLAINCYHVDDPAGLKALADTIKGLVALYQARIADTATAQN